MYISAPFYKKLAVGLLVISFSAIAGIAEATLLYEQAPIDPIDGYEADTSSALLADDFTVAHVTLESVSWWGTYLFKDTDDFVVKLYRDLAGTGALLHDFGSVSFVQTPFTDSTSFDYYKYQFDLSTPLELLAGSYYLSIQNQGLSTWFWLYGNPGNGSSSSLEPPPPVSNWDLNINPQDLAFRVEGSPIQAVPEPDTTMLMLLGGSMLTMSFKLRRPQIQVELNRQRGGSPPQRCGK